MQMRCVVTKQTLRPILLPVVAYVVETAILESAHVSFFTNYSDLNLLL